MTGFDHQALRTAIEDNAAAIRWNDGVPALVSAAIGAGEGHLTAHGAFAVNTGQFTGRSVKDKFVVRDGRTADRVWWENNAPMSPEQFALLQGDIVAHLRGKSLFAQDLAAGADVAHRLSVSVITETAWHALFIRNLLIRSAAPQELPADVTILHAPSFAADPARHGTRSATVIALDLERRLVLIGGTAYAGEIKKAVFTLFNYHAPFADVLPMHCSANIGASGDVALFFGLSGTGKTTLSSDPARRLVGDDEHGWSEGGVFNLEGGCYAKTAKLSAAAEPEIHAATRRFGTVLENVALTEASEPDYDDLTRTENGRAAYQLDALQSVAVGGVGGTPSTVVFLTADAFGVLPPIAKLTTEQAVFHFLSGYTAKIAGTERGVTEPVATFSACFGAPFMPLHPRVYGDLLTRRLAESGARCFLLNTGWTGGAYGVGQRMPIVLTRKLLAAALCGELDGVETRLDPVFGLAVPTAVAGIETEVLDSRRTWSNGDDYDMAANRLAALFSENARRFEERAEAAQ